MAPRTVELDPQGDLIIERPELNKATREASDEQIEQDSGSSASARKRSTLRSAVTRKISEAQMVSGSPVTKSMPQLLFSTGIELFVIAGDDVQQSRFTSRLGAYSAIPRSTLFR
ncbi:hypothetical protein IF2G_10985 [Cordyceps javanica]|nr:hypothetical protein IF2G_10985 [Cordyceps javanica]